MRPATGKDCDWKEKIVGSFSAPCGLGVEFSLRALVEKVNVKFALLLEVEAQVCHLACRLLRSVLCLAGTTTSYFRKPPVGIEPTTLRLLSACSTD